MKQGRVEFVVFMELEFVELFMVLLVVLLAVFEALFVIFEEFVKLFMVA